MNEINRDGGQGGFVVPPEIRDRLLTSLYSGQPIPGPRWSLNSLLGRPEPGETTADFILRRDRAAGIDERITWEEIRLMGDAAEAIQNPIVEDDPPAMRGKLLDTETGEVVDIGGHFADAADVWWAEGGGSCDCNRALLFGIELPFGVCAGADRFLVVESDSTRYSLRELNQDYPAALLEEYLPVNGTLYYQVMEEVRPEWEVRRLYAAMYNHRHRRKKVSWRRLNRPQLARAYELFGMRKVERPVASWVT